MTLVLVICSTLVILAFLLGMKVREGEVKLLKSTNAMLESRLEKSQGVNVDLINTLMLMRQQGQIAPPMEESWEPYTTDEGDAELEGSLES